MAKGPKEEDVESFLLNNVVDQTADYAQRGRRFEALSPDQLSEKWCGAFRDMAASPSDGDKRALEKGA